MRPTRADRSPLARQHQGAGRRQHAAHPVDQREPRAGHLPTLGATISYGDSSTWGQNRVVGQGVPTGSEGYDTTIGLRLSIPLFSGFLTQSQVRQSLYTRDATEDQLEQERRAVTRQTRNAFRALMAGLSGIEARKQALVSAQSAMEATEAGFEVGTRTIVDVLISQQTLLQAQSAYSTARHAYVLNRLLLKQAAGVIEVQDLEAINALLE